METRRQFLGGLGLGMGVLAVGRGRSVEASGCPIDATSVGVVKAETHQHARVWLDGEDVSTSCFYADDERGFVRCYRINANGDRYVWGHPTADPDPLTRVTTGEWIKRYTRVNGRLVWARPYPGCGDVAWDEFVGDVRIVT